MCVTGNGGVQSSPDNVTPIWVQETVRCPEGSEQYRTWLLGWLAWVTQVNY